MKKKMMTKMKSRGYAANLEDIGTWLAAQSG